MAAAPSRERAAPRHDTNASSSSTGFFLSSTTSELPSFALMSNFYFYSFFFTQTPFYLPRPAVTGFYRVFYRDFTEFLPSFSSAATSTGLVYHCVQVTEFCFDELFLFLFIFFYSNPFLPTPTGCYWVLPSFLPRFYRVFTEFLPSRTSFLVYLSRFPLRCCRVFHIRFDF